MPILLLLLSSATPYCVAVFMRAQGSEISSLPYSLALFYEVCDQSVMTSVLQGYFSDIALTRACMGDSSPSELENFLPSPIPTNREDMANAFFNAMSQSSTTSSLNLAFRKAAEQVPIEVAPIFRANCLKGDIVACTHAVVYFCKVTITPTVSVIPKSLEPLFRLHLALSNLNIQLSRQIVSQNLPTVIASFLNSTVGTWYQEDLAEGDAPPGMWYAELQGHIRSRVMAEAQPVSGLELLFETAREHTSVAERLSFWVTYYSSQSLSDIIACISTFVKECNKAHLLKTASWSVIHAGLNAPPSLLFTRFMHAVGRKELVTLDEYCSFVHPAFAVQLRDALEDPHRLISEDDIDAMLAILEGILGDAIMTRSGATAMAA